MPKTKPPAKTAARRAAGQAASASVVSAWQDDPVSALPLISRPVPNLSKGSLKFKIKGTAIPAAVYAAGTAGFRYWTAAEALRRGGDFWGPLMGLNR